MQALLLYLPGHEYYEEDMKLREEDKVWLTTEIESQISKAIMAAGEVFRPEGWRKATNFLREWGLVTVTIATPLTLLAIVVTLAIFAGTGIKESALFRGQTGTRLDAIEKRLDKIDNALTASKLTRDIESSTDNPRMVLRR